MLILEYKQGDSYCIILNNQRQMISEFDLKQLIRKTPASERNCKISNNNICMKAGYGKLPIKRLVSDIKVRSYNHEKRVMYGDKVKDYVEILFDEPSDAQDKYIKYPEELFDFYSLSEFKPYLFLLEYERVKIIDMETEEIETRFGRTNASKLSSGMKSMLMALKYANEIPGYIVDVSCCSKEYLKILCPHLIGKDIKIVVRHGDIYMIETKLKYQGKIFTNGNDLWNFKGGIFN